MRISEAIVRCLFFASLCIFAIGAECLFFNALATNALLTKTRKPKPEINVTFKGPGYLIDVDYTISLDEMVARGNYNWQNKDITADHFQIVGEGKIGFEAEIVSFDRVITLEQTLAELARRGLRPATIEELLAFGAQYPEVQRQFDVVALGSSYVFEGSRGYPYLTVCSGKRGIYLGYPDTEGQCFYSCRNKYLAVRERLCALSKRGLSCESTPFSVSTSDVGTIVVDYDRKIEDVIAEQKYNSYDTDLTSQNYPTNSNMHFGKVATKAFLIRFSWSMHSREIIAWMQKNGYRPANLRELISFTATCTKQIQVAAFGSVHSVDNEVFNPSFINERDGLKKYLNCYAFEGRHRTDTSFLAVRELPEPEISADEMNYKFKMKNQAR